MRGNDRGGDAGCGTSCATADGAELNRSCGCAVVDVPDVLARLASRLPTSAALDPVRHAHLFSPHALFVDRDTLARMASTARAVFAIARLPGYLESVLSYAPDVARRDPGSPGGVLGLDFHLTAEGPRLIEINTNPGGLLLNAALLDAVRACAPGTWQPWSSASDVADAAADAWLDDLALQRAGVRPRRVAIVDSAPFEQFLAPEFELYAQAFRARGVDTLVCPPESLTVVAGQLLHGIDPVDGVYNRLTDFALAEPASAALAYAWSSGAVAMSPHPHAHAVFADKRNLALVGDADALRGFGAPDDVARELAGVIPATETVTLDAAERLWRDRDGLFFKPAAGYGSRGSYRGDKVTRRVWEAVLQGDYVAQAFAPPGLRLLHGGQTLKADVRCYATAHATIAFAARLYQGQTTNMRTPGGGFAAVFTTPDPA